MPYLEKKNKGVLADLGPITLFAESDIYIRMHPNKILTKSTVCIPSATAGLLSSYPCGED
jgi:hypothetical protein